MLLKPSVAPSSRISASGTAVLKAWTSGIEPPVTTLIVSPLHAFERAARAASVGAPGGGGIEPMTIGYVWGRSSGLYVLKPGIAQQFHHQLAGVVHGLGRERRLGDRRDSRELDQ